MEANSGLLEYAFSLDIVRRYYPYLSIFKGFFCRFSVVLSAEQF